MSEKEREENPVAPEAASREKPEKAIDRRRFMGLTFKAVVGGMGLTLFAQTRPAHAVTCDGVPNVCDEGGENECYGLGNACDGTGGSNTCSATYANVCNDGGDQQNVCAGTAPNECVTAGGANDCYAQVYNSCVTGSTNTCDRGWTNKCTNGASNTCG
ncbi:MAG TPA: hypothetical protein VM492_08330, partial [Sumerlaeia bacterium]|nr:hypothetical protein [Sumerlaeia bacterium]